MSNQNTSSDRNEQVLEGTNDPPSTPITNLDTNQVDDTVEQRATTTSEYPPNPPTIQELETST